VTVEEDRGDHFVRSLASSPTSAGGWPLRYSESGWDSPPTDDNDAIWPGDQSTAGYRPVRDESPAEGGAALETRRAFLRGVGTPDRKGTLVESAMKRLFRSLFSSTVEEGVDPTDRKRTLVDSAMNTPFQGLSSSTVGEGCGLY
jgi:hypothetical protein